MSNSDGSVGAFASDIAVVIPSFNSAPWLPSTLDALEEAARVAGITVNVIVVDDGSTDGTAELLRDRPASHSMAVSVVTQGNRGRFAARFVGASTATAAHIILLDSRVLMHPDSIRYLLERLAEPGSLRAWNGHIEIDEQAPLIGRLWEVLTHIFWRDYLAKPRPMHITLDNFDRMPKGTTLFAVDRHLFLEACERAWPTADTHLVSDDTSLLRALVAVTPIQIDPGFAATYRPRTSFGPFMRHTLDRGTLFVDSYAGTTLARSLALIALAAAPLVGVLVIAIALVAGQAWIAIAIAAVAVIALGIPPVVGARCGAPRRALLAYALFIIPFGLAFWVGLVRGLVIHRAAFARRQPSTQASEVSP
ncbi:MAG: glycosyltransferase family 2 protein [Microbacterium sp.]|nr:glycosyltransferase family 2 protein [Microbacterium sp.]MBA4346852.1 glycosyltransferase family 2 protein [Microbacterium sp.]